jgi:hypothetical protein
VATRGATQRAETPQDTGVSQIWLIEPRAAPDDPWWQGRPIWQLVVAAPSAAFARLAAERWALDQRQFVPVGNESTGLNAGFTDEKLYLARPLPEGVGPTRDEFDDNSVIMLAGPMQSVARA